MNETDTWMGVQPRTAGFTYAYTSAPIRTMVAIAASPVRLMRLTGRRMRGLADGGLAECVVREFSKLAAEVCAPNRMPENRPLQPQQYLAPSLFAA
ncbi:hypothetical protein AB4Z46_21445 [Variovorax sp. M-6]|uniref:hypothetical protein n=1 Tax=Variovorax sp. M-6 TaxID=3233041 RepID=UPI003F9C6C70